MTSRWQEPMPLDAFKLGKRLGNKRDGVVTREELAEAVVTCRYRTIFGARPGQSFTEATKNCGGLLVIVDYRVEPIQPHELERIVRALRNGQTFLVVAARSEDREYVRAEVRRALRGDLPEQELVVK